MENLKDILDKYNTLSDLSRYFYSKNNYSNREKCKKILLDNGVDYKKWLESKKKRSYCLFCGKEIFGKYRLNKKFCNSSCAAKYNNKRKTKKIKYCLYCGNIITSKKYCNNECKNKHKEELLIDKWQNGEILGCDISGNIRTFLRNYLYRKFNYKCQKCGFDKVNKYTGNTILQIHHVDGDTFNTKENNLMVLCPNCHSLTENFGSRNKKCTRVDRRTKKFHINEK